MSEWRTTTIDEIKAPIPSSLAMGPFGSNIKTDNFVPDGVPIIRGGNLNAGRFNEDNFVYLTEEKANELKSSNAFPLDIVFTHRGTLGQVGIIPKNSRYPRYVVSQSQMKLTCDQSKVDPFFVFYFFKSHYGQHALLSNTSTTGVPALSQPLTSLKKIELPLPPLTEQHAIVHILGSLDDKIELNCQMNETLEAIGRTIFKSWFVDFDPIRAKMEGRQPAGIDEETAALFPNEFEVINGQEVPKGWLIEPLGNIINLEYGKALKEGNRIPGNIPVFGSNGQIGWHNEKLADGPGIIVGRKGNPGFVKWSTTDFFAIDTTFYVILKKDGIFLSYLYYVLGHQNLQLLSSDSAVPGLNRNFVYMNKILIPPIGILKKFDAFVTDLKKSIQINDVQSITLAEIRDLLLPRLISGNIRIPISDEVL
jgi:type I restriction enzyme S subunit